MKISIKSEEKDKSRVIWLPTWLFLNRFVLNFLKKRIRQESVNLDELNVKKLMKLSKELKRMKRYHPGVFLLEVYTNDEEIKIKL